MNYKKLDMGSYQLHLIPTDRFKTILTRVCLRDKTVKEEITLRNFLTNFLTYSTATYKTKRELVLKAQDLYAANVHTKAYRAGNYNMISFYLSILAEEYTENGMIEQSIALLSDILFNPNFEDDETFDEAFHFLYSAMENAIQGLKEDPTLYSTVRMLENLGEDQPYSFHEHGYMEDLEKINRSTLMEYYQKVMNHSLVDIYIIGNFDEQEMIGIIKKYMKFETFKRPKESQIIFHEKLPKKIKTVKESTEGAQSKLSIGCKIDSLNEFERNYVLTIYNFLLGSGSESKFFRIIREKHSLAY
ncbi:MAG: insulinase family protein, partial [Bacilli bacterium]|nr:insulinase family protein [Bacilli bacterium]